MVETFIQERFSLFFQAQHLSEIIMSFAIIVDVTKESLAYFTKLMDKFQAFLISNQTLSELANSFSSQEITPCCVSSDLSERLIVFSQDFAPGQNYHQLLVNSLIKKNLYWIEEYYTRVSFSSLSRKLQVDQHLIEEQLTEMVFMDRIYARIDRPSQVIRFTKPSNNSMRMDSWIEQVNRTVELIDLVTERVERRITVE